MQPKPTVGATALALVSIILTLSSGSYEVWRGFRLASVAAKKSYLLHDLRAITMSFDLFSMWLWLEAELSGVAAIILLLGAIGVLAQASAGRWLVLIGSVVIIEHTIIGWSATVKMHHWFAALGDDEFGQVCFETPSVPVIILLSFLVPMANAILIWLPATRSWWRVTGTRSWWLVSWLKQAPRALLAKIREGLRPPLGTAPCSPIWKSANLTNDTR